MLGLKNFSKKISTKSTKHTLTCLSQYNFSKRTTIPSERNWDPKEIYPPRSSGPSDKTVRVTGITLRDGHQSLNGGLHRIDLLNKAAPLIDKIRPPDMKYPGQEEIGGGTTVDFPLRFKGENPFRNMEIISSQLPNTPTSCLIRSDSLCGYNINPKDVVNKFITRYAQCGLDIFRVFDAYNNVSNHAAVAEAVLNAGKHYQAAITFTSHQDPTIFNPIWVAEICKGFAKLGAHSICIKDMAGIASPELMRQWVTAIKDAIPELPIILHAHYTTGFSPIGYILGIEAGASGIDCGISTLSGRSGHPAMEVFNQTLYDMGYDLGWDHVNALDAMKKVADIYREYHPRYEFCEMNMAGAVDYRVFTQGIPGGQISIMKNELVRNGFGHLFDPVIEQIQRVRDQVGGVALVTPTSEHVARQSIVNAMAGQSITNDKSPLWPGYSEMLRGVMGRPPLFPDPELQKRALREWTEGVIKSLNLDDRQQGLTKELQSKVSNIVDIMWKESEIVREIRDATDLESRIRQLTTWNSTKYNKEISESQSKLDKLNELLKGKNKQEIDDNYTSILSKQPSDELYKKLVKNCDLNNYESNKLLSKDEILNIIKAASFCTVTPSTIIPPGMEQARCEVEKFAVEHDFEIPERGTEEFEEYAVLQCMFRHAQNIALNWFKHNQTNPKFWDKHFPKDFPFDRDEEIDKNIKPLMYPYRTKCDDNTKNNAQIIEWSTTELNRVLTHNMNDLSNAYKLLNEIKNRKTENENRKILKDRALDKQTKIVNDLENEISNKIKTSLFNIRSFEAGYNIDVEQSIKLNFNKILKNSGIESKRYQA